MRNLLLATSLLLGGCAGSGTHEDLVLYCVGTNGGLTPVMQAVCKRLSEVSP